MAIHKTVLKSPAELVALDVIEELGNNRRPNITEIGVNRGYARSTAAKGMITRNPIYKRTIKRFEDKIGKTLEDITTMASNQIKERLRVKEKTTLRDLAYISDLAVKNRNLIQGKATENIAMETVFTTTEEARKYIEAELASDNG